jgi:hypothetical protein
MVKGYLIMPILALGLTLSGCHRTPETYSAACATPLNHWSTEKDGIGHLLEIMPVFIVTDGTALWNKTAISNAQLRAYMNQASDLNPVPQVILEVSPSASCQRVREVRAIMDAAPMCKGPHSRCSEGWNPNQWPMVGGP